MKYIIEVPYEINSCQSCPCKHFDKFSTVCHLSNDGERRYGSCPLKQLDSPWHTGTPTEEGWYLVVYHKRDCDGSFYWDYGTRVWEDYGEYGHWNITSMKYPVIKWQKINELVEED